MPFARENLQGTLLCLAVLIAFFIWARCPYKHALIRFCGLHIAAVPTGGTSRVGPFVCQVPLYVKSLYVSPDTLRSSPRTATPRDKTVACTFLSYTNQEEIIPEQDPFVCLVRNFCSSDSLAQRLSVQSCAKTVRTGTSMDARIEIRRGNTGRQDKFSAKGAEEHASF